VPTDFIGFIGKYLPRAYIVIGTAWNMHKRQQTRRARVLKDIDS